MRDAVIIQCGAWLGVVLLFGPVFDGSTADKSEKIPLGAVYSSFQQKPLTSSVWLTQGWSVEKETQAREAGYRPMLSNLFLVRGKDISEAVNDTQQVYFNRRAVDTIVLPVNDPQSHLWLFVLFGAGSSDPTLYTIESIERSSEKVKVVFRSLDPAKPRVRTADVHRYTAWVPLAHLTIGTHVLALFDSRTQDTTLMRRVIVAEQ